MSGKTKRECSKPIEDTKPKMPENIHFDPDLNDLYEDNRNSGRFKNPVVAPTVPWTRDGF
jgi:hypothetical protein